MTFPKHIGISKSRYTLFRQCPKALWLRTYKPELCIISDTLQQRFQAGSVVGDLAKGLFGKFVDVTSYSDNGTLNLNKMIIPTMKAYLQFPAGSGARMIYIQEPDGSTTAINVITGEQQNFAKGAWYTIDGVMVNGIPTAKGVYIQNGKKVVIK